MGFIIQYNGKEFTSNSPNNNFNVVRGSKAFSVVPVIDLSSYAKIQNIKAGTNININYSSTGLTISSTGGGNYVSATTFNYFTGVTAPSTYLSKITFNNYTGTSTGTIAGATNGLSVFNKNVKLGGVLTGSTALTLTGSGSSLTVGSNQPIYNTRVLINSTTDSGSGYPSAFSPITILADSLGQIWYLNTSTSSLIVDSNAVPIIGTTLTTFNNSSANYSGDLIPSGGINGGVIVNDVIYYYSANQGGFYSFDTVNLINTYYGSSTGNYSGDLLVTGFTISLAGDNSNLIALVPNSPASLFIYDIGANTVTKYTTSPTNYSGTTIPTIGLTNVLLCGNAVYARNKTSSLVWKLNLINHGAVQFTSSSGNYTGDLLPSSSISQIDTDGINYVWIKTNAGLYKFNHSTRVSTKFTTTSTNYSGDKLQTNSLSSIKVTSPNYVWTNSITQLGVFNVTGNSFTAIKSIFSQPFDITSVMLPKIELSNGETIINTGIVTAGVIVVVPSANTLTLLSDNLGFRYKNSGLPFVGKQKYFIDRDYLDTYLNAGTAISIDRNNADNKLYFNLGGTIKQGATLNLLFDGTNNSLVLGGDQSTYPNASQISLFNNITGSTGFVNINSNNIALTATNDISQSASISITPTEIDLTSNLKLTTIGSGMYLKEGSNATMGVITLVGGTAVVNTNKVTANSRILLTSQGGGTNHGAHYVSARTAGTSFTVTSTNSSDTDSIFWIIFEPVAAVLPP